MIICCSIHRIIYFSQLQIFTTNSIWLKFTGVWGKIIPMMGQFHKALPTAKRAYVTLQDFAVSVTLCNSALDPHPPTVLDKVLKKEEEKLMASLRT